jgi:hypothetical protein
VPRSLARASHAAEGIKKEKGKKKKKEYHRYSMLQLIWITPCESGANIWNKVGDMSAKEEPISPKQLIYQRFDGSPRSSGPQASHVSTIVAVAVTPLHVIRTD